MTIDKAIELLSESANTGVTTFGQDFKDAERLGIEALKRLQAIRARDPLEAVTILPGKRRNSLCKL